MSKQPARNLREMMAEKASEGGPKTLYWWLRSRYAELASAKEETGATWAQFTATVIEAGARLGSGEEPGEAAVRKAFLKAGADLAGKEQRRPVVPAARRTVVSPVVPPAPPTAPATPADDDLADLRAGMAGSARKLPKPL